MDASFWHQRWRANEIPFHEHAVNQQLLKHFSALSLAKAGRVFVPLCGKSLDIGWLLSRGHAVAGAELSEIAVQQLFVELGMEPRLVELGTVRHYRGQKIDIFVGDIFQVSREMLSPVDAVYDRAAFLLLAVMKAESSFNPLVVSRAGAVGLMQLVPETAMRHGVRNLYDTDENIAGGARHLRYLLDRFHGNTRVALAAYNAGERKVDRYRKIPPHHETRQYVRRVLSYYRDYRKEGWLAQPPQKHAERFVVETF